MVDIPSDCDTLESRVTSAARREGRSFVPTPRDDASEQETYPVAAIGDRTTERLSLVVLAPGGVSTHELPAVGSITLGRSSRSDIQIADPSISRHHAVIELGPRPRIRDAGSHNGIRVGTQRLANGASAEILPGMAIELGRVVVVLHRGEAGVVATPASNATVPVPADVVVEDEAMKDVYALLERVARSELSVLLLGETGVGKEVLAEHLHRCSPRARRPLVRLNCAALSPTLLESELFGHEKGAFTGAIAAKPGLLETANGGTVFLDEVGELSLDTQVKLLRVIEAREVPRVGSLAPRAVDVRFVSATHRDLAAEITNGRFRQDFFFRLNGIAIEIPALRARPKEIETLAELFVARARRGVRQDAASAIESDARQCLLRYAWPGNVRELRNVMERAVVLAGDQPITPQHLPREVIAAVAAQPPVAAAAAAPGMPSALRDEINALERDRILAALEKCGGNQTRAAEMLGMRRATLVARLEAWGVPRPRKSGR
jgi:DNA-binding NtrC family response regulator